MILGFTGTRKGMSPNQKMMLARFMGMLAKDITQVHHGMCVGADLDFHLLAKWFGFKIILHPPDVPVTNDLVAWSCFEDVPKRHIRPALPHLSRNDQIVLSSDFMFCCPPTAKETVRGGTWYTIRQAIKTNTKYRVCSP